MALETCNYSADQLIGSVGSVQGCSSSPTLFSVTDPIFRIAGRVARFRVLGRSSRVGLWKISGRSSLDQSIGSKMIISTF